MGAAFRTAGFGYVVSFQTATITTAANLPTIPDTAVYAMVTIDGTSVRVRSDGTSPTTTVGHLYTSGSHLEISKPELANIEFVAVSGSATLSVTYYGE